MQCLQASRRSPARPRCGGCVRRAGARRAALLSARARRARLGTAARAGVAAARRDRRLRGRTPAADIGGVRTPTRASGYGPAPNSHCTCRDRTVVSALRAFGTSRASPTPSRTTSPRPPARGTPMIPVAAHARGWERMQWNMLAGAGVDAPQAWANLLADHRAGGKGVASRARHRGRVSRLGSVPRSRRTSAARGSSRPTTSSATPTRWTAGHGTFVAGGSASDQQRRRSHRPGVRRLDHAGPVLNARRRGRRGDDRPRIRYAVPRRQVINLSLEFRPTSPLRLADPGIVSAVNFAHRPGHRGRRRGQRQTHGRVPGAGPGRDLGRRHDQGQLPGRLLQRRDRPRPGRARRWRRRDMSADPDCHPNRAPAARLPDDAARSAVRARLRLPRLVLGTSMAAPEVAAPPRW